MKTTVSVSRGPAPVGDDEQRKVARLIARRRRLGQRDLVLGIATPVVLIALWQLVASAGLIDTRIFTAPVDIFETGVELIESGALPSDALTTMTRLVVGFVLGVTTGIATGMFMGYFRVIRASLSPTLTALYAVPKIAILPLLLVIFGLGETPRVLLVVISTFFILQIGTMDAVRNFDPRLLEAGRAFGATGPKAFWYVVLPGSMPGIFTGLRLSAGVAMIVVTATEFVAADNGLGYLIWNSWTLFQPPKMYVGLMAAAVLGAAFAGLVAWLERIVMPWQRAASGKRKRRARSLREP